MDADEYENSGRVTWNHRWARDENKVKREN